MIMARLAAHPVEFAPPVTWPSVSAVPNVTIDERPNIVRARVPQFSIGSKLYSQLLSLHRMYLEIGEPDGARLASLAMAGDVASGEALVRRLLDSQDTDRAERLAYGLKTEHGETAVQKFVVDLADRYSSVPY